MVYKLCCEVNIQVSRVSFRVPNLINKNFRDIQNVSQPKKTISFGSSYGDSLSEELMKANIEQRKYSDEIYQSCFTPVYDDKGKLITDKKGRVEMTLLPEIKNRLDGSVFKFKDFNDEEFKGSIKEAFKKFIMNLDAQPEVMERLFHGTSQESINAILEKGVRIPRSTNTYFGPGMYFAMSEGDAQDYSPAKLIADITRVTRKNGEKGKFVRVYGDYYDRIKDAAILDTTQIIDDVTGINGRPLPNEPYYRLNARYSLPLLILGEYCRRVLVDDLGIDAAYASAPHHHSCVVVFNADSVKNIQKYK